MTQPSLACAMAILATLVWCRHLTGQRDSSSIGQEVAIQRHLQDGDEYRLSTEDLLAHGRLLFDAVWTAQEGGGRPLTKGTGNPLSDPHSPLVFPRAFNRISARDANSCAGCHNAPFGISGGGGDFVTEVFVLGQRFDFATFDRADFVATKGALQENGLPAQFGTIANYRATLGMLGSGYIELLAREMTAELQALRDAALPGKAKALVTKGVSFGTITRRLDGTWDTSQVVGLPAPSLATTGANDPPKLLIQPFHQAGAVVSLRVFSNNAFNHHHGIQSTERFGINTDPDGDGFVNEMTRADVTAVSMFQAALQVPGRVIPNDRAVEAAVKNGAHLFRQIGCAECHIPSLPLNSSKFIEPNPFNPPGNLRPGQAPDLAIDLNDKHLPEPRLKAEHGVTSVPAFTDLKLHDICASPSDPNIEPLNMLAAPGSAGFFAGNRQFLTKKLWGSANEPPFFHHGQYTTLREAILAHAGEALQARQGFDGLSAYGRDSIVEYLKTFQVLRPGTKDLIVDEKGHKKDWKDDE